MFQERDLPGLQQAPERPVVVRVRIRIRAPPAGYFADANLAQLVRVVPDGVVFVFQGVHGARGAEKVDRRFYVVVAVDYFHSAIFHQLKCGENVESQWKGLKMELEVAKKRVLKCQSF